MRVPCSSWRAASCVAGHDGGPPVGMQRAGLVRMVAAGNFVAEIVPGPDGGCENRCATRSHAGEDIVCGDGCQGWGRGFESRRPLQTPWSGPCKGPHTAGIRAQFPEAGTNRDGTAWYRSVWPATSWASSRRRCPTRPHPLNVATRVRIPLGLRSRQKRWSGCCEFALELW